jgi:hypothetical protein
LSRIRTLILFAVLVALVSALSACGGGSSNDPQTIVDEATLQGVESGQIDMSLGLDISGEKSGHLDASLSGPFQSEEGAELPELDLTAKANGTLGGENIDFQGGLTLLGGNRAYVEYEGTEYEVDPTTYNYVRSLTKGQGQGNESSEVTACQEAAAELDVAEFVDNLKNDGSADVDGTATTKISGDLNASGALDSLTTLVEDPACGEQLEATGTLPSAAELEKAKSTVDDSVKSAHVDLYVGDDHIVRRIAVQATIEPPPGKSSKGVKKASIDFDLKLTGVNEEQTISAPHGAKPLSALFLKLNINPIELLGILQSGNGIGGLGGLLEGIAKGSGGSSKGSSGQGGGSGGGQQAYLNCLKEAATPVDIQNCTGLLQ